MGLIGFLRSRGFFERFEIGAGTQGLLGSRKSRC